MTINNGLNFPIINDSSMAAATTSNLSTSAAIKIYVDSVATGLNIQPSVLCASTGALTATYYNGSAGVGATLTNAGAFAIFTVDGVSPAVNSRVLIKNQASSLQNGIYTVTTVGDAVSVNWVLTRATDFDTVAEIQVGDWVVVTSGTALGNSSWLQTATVTVVGVSSITFIQFTTAVPVAVTAGGTGLTSTTINQLLYSSAANTIAGLATVNSAGLLTNGSGVPGWVAYTGTGAPVLGTTPTLVRPSATNLIYGYSTTATAAGTTTLTVSSNYQQFFTGITTQNLVMPVTSTLTVGQSWLVVNNSTGIVTVKSSGGNTILAMSGGTNSIVTCIAQSGTTASDWNAEGTSGVAGVDSITGTANQVIASASVGPVTLSLPQSIGTASAVQFASARLGANGLIDTNGLEILALTATATAVNYLTLANAATGGNPSFTATGSDSNIIMQLIGKGTGGIAVKGSSTNDTASAGYVGEIISSSVVYTTVNLSTGVAANVTSISLTAGDWNVWGQILFYADTTTVVASSVAAVSRTSATLPSVTTLDISQMASFCQATYSAGSDSSLSVPVSVMQLSGTTTVYLVASCNFSVSTTTAGGAIIARRVR